MHRALGIERAMIVQSKVYRAGHSALLDALAENGLNYRGCSVISDAVNGAELRWLHRGPSAAGVDSTPAERL